LTSDWIFSLSTFAFILDALSTPWANAISHKLHYLLLLLRTTIIS
jgi:hypothetical protein